MSNVQAMGLSMAFRNATNARSYMEVLHRTPFSTRVQVLSLKANHPDDAKLWLRDMQASNITDRNYFEGSLCCRRDAVALHQPKRKHIDFVCMMQRNECISCLYLK